MADRGVLAQQGQKEKEKEKEKDKTLSVPIPTPIPTPSTLAHGPKLQIKQRDHEYELWARHIDRIFDPAQRQGQQTPRFTRVVFTIQSLAIDQEGKAHMEEIFTNPCVDVGQVDNLRMLAGDCHLPVSSQILYYMEGFGRCSHRQFKDFIRQLVKDLMNPTKRRRTNSTTHTVGDHTIVCMSSETTPVLREAWKEDRKTETWHTVPCISDITIDLTCLSVAPHDDKERIVKFTNGYAAIVAVSKNNALFQRPDISTLHVAIHYAGTIQTISDMDFQAEPLHYVGLPTIICNLDPKQLSDTLMFISKLQMPWAPMLFPDVYYG